MDIGWKGWRNIWNKSGTKVELLQVILSFIHKQFSSTRNPDESAGPWCYHSVPSNANGRAWKYCTIAESCPGPKQFVDETKGVTGGYLGLVAAGTDFHKDHRIPGSVMKYQCSAGFDTGEGVNDEQEFKCTAGRKVSFDNMLQCRRKYQMMKTLPPLFV